MPLLLVAQSPQGEKRRWTLAEVSIVGRSHPQAPAELLQVEGDERLSRQHFRIEPGDGKARVERLPQARNPLVFEGDEQDRFELRVGQFFFAGRTQFFLVQAPTAGEFTLVGQARQRARQRRAEEYFGAVIELLSLLRREGEDPGSQAIQVLIQLLPASTFCAFLEQHDASWEVLAQHPASPPVEFDDEMLRVLREAQGTTWKQDEEQESAQEETLRAWQTWQMVSPFSIAEGARFALWLRGHGPLAQQEAEDVAALVDLVAELLGHHLAVRQAAEYGGLLAVFGHHVGTLFKASGALELYSTTSDPSARRVIERLLPIWGVSQAISLHKKQAETSWQQLRRDWVEAEPPRTEDLRAAVRNLVGYVHSAGSEPPYLPWYFEGEKLGLQDGRLTTLPPLRDQPLLFDRTLALCVGLLEMLSNLRKYPEPRGSGREDRRELSELPEPQRQVHFRLEMLQGCLRLEVEQPVVTRGDGSLPRSASLQRIRPLELLLLHSLVETGELQVVAATSSPWVVRARQSWTYRWGRLCL